MNVHCPFCSSNIETEDYKPGLHKLICTRCGRMYLLEVKLYFKFFKNIRTFII